MIYCEPKWLMSQIATWGEGRLHTLNADSTPRYKFHQLIIMILLSFFSPIKNRNLLINRTTMGNKLADGFILDFEGKLPWKWQMTVAFQWLTGKARLRESDTRAAESSQERQSILCWDQAVHGQLQSDHKCHIVVYRPKWPTETPQVKTLDLFCRTGGD